MTTGASVSERRRKSCALAASIETGWACGTPAPRPPRIGRLLEPGGMSMNRTTMGPVTPVATGTVALCMLADGGMSPCQPLTSRMWPSASLAARPLPRLGTL